MQIVPKWIFFRIYVLTATSSNSSRFIYRIYEIDLYYKVYALVKEFESNFSKIFLVPDPFQGFFTFSSFLFLCFKISFAFNNVSRTVSYSYENKFQIVNSVYLNLSENYLNSMSSPDWNSKEFTQVVYEPMHNDSGVCQRHVNFSFVQSSTSIRGFKDIQTFFVKTKSSNPILEYVECSVFESDCTCVSMEKDHKNTFKQCIISNLFAFVYLIAYNN
jgi:hypothetical protein